MRTLSALAAWVASARGRVVGWGCCKCELWFWSEHRHRGALGKALTVTVDATLGVQRAYERVHDSTMYAVRASINEMQRCQKGKCDGVGDGGSGRRGTGRSCEISNACSRVQRGT